MIRSPFACTVVGAGVSQHLEEPADAGSHDRHFCFCLLNSDYFFSIRSSPPM
jgi:hypothetical protein